NGAAGHACAGDRDARGWSTPTAPESDPIQMPTGAAPGLSGPPTRADADDSTKSEYTRETIDDTRRPLARGSPAPRRRKQRDGRPAGPLRRARGTDGRRDLHAGGRGGDSRSRPRPAGGAA